MVISTVLSGFSVFAVVAWVLWYFYEKRQKKNSIMGRTVQQLQGPARRLDALGREGLGMNFGIEDRVKYPGLVDWTGKKFEKTADYLATKLGGGRRSNAEKRRTRRTRTRKSRKSRKSRTRKSRKSRKSRTRKSRKSRKSRTRKSRKSRKSRTRKSRN